MELWELFIQTKFKERRLVIMNEKFKKEDFDRILSSHYRGTIIRGYNSNQYYIDYYFPEENMGVVFNYSSNINEIFNYFKNFGIVLYIMYPNQYNEFPSLTTYEIFRLLKCNMGMRKGDISECSIKKLEENIILEEFIESNSGYSINYVIDLNIGTYIGVILVGVMRFQIIENSIILRQYIPRIGFYIENMMEKMIEFTKDFLSNSEEYNIECIKATMDLTNPSYQSEYESSFQERINYSPSSSYIMNNTIYSELDIIQASLDIQFQGISDTDSSKKNIYQLFRDDPYSYSHVCNCGSYEYMTNK